MSKINSSNTANSDIADQYRLQQTEKEELQAAHEKEIENLKKSYEKEKQSLTDRYETSTQTETLKHYDNLRNTKRQLKRAEDDLVQKKEQWIDQKTTELNHEQINTEDSGKRAIEETKKKYAAGLEYEQKEAADAEMVVRNSHKKSAEAILKDSEKKIGDLYATKNTELELANARNAEAINQIHHEFENQRVQNNNQYSTGLKEMQNKTQADLDARRAQNAQKLEAYSTRQSDPFYQMVRLDSEMSDTGDAYVIRVKVPEHEREKFRVQISGQEVLLSGTRSNNEKMEISPGNWSSTSSYQNYTERYPFPTPIDAKTLTSREDGDWMEYTVFKYGPNHHQHAQELTSRSEQMQDRVTQVNFPDTLPKPSVVPRRTV